MNMLVGILADRAQKTAEECVDKLLADALCNAMQCNFTRMDKDMDGVITDGVFKFIRSGNKLLKALTDLKIHARRFDKFARPMFENDAQTDPSEEPRQPTTLGLTAFCHAFERHNELMRSKTLQLEKALQLDKLVKLRCVHLGGLLQVAWCCGP